MPGQSESSPISVSIAIQTQNLPSLACNASQERLQSNRYGASRMRKAGNQFRTKETLTTEWGYECKRKNHERYAIPRLASKRPGAYHMQMTVDVILSNVQSMPKKISSQSPSTVTNAGTSREKVWGRRVHPTKPNETICRGGVRRDLGADDRRAVNKGTCTSRPTPDHFFVGQMIHPVILLALRH